MALNLKKHEKDLLKGWEQMIKSNTVGKWICYGYEPKTFNLQTVGSGDGGLEELVEEFSDGRIMYGGVVVEDPNSKLFKTVFIVWQGMSVPEQIRGKCATHADTVCSFFKGFHVNIVARSENDVAESVVLDKVMKSSGANYSFHKEVRREEPKDDHIINSYTKIDPRKEITEASKTGFWEKHRELPQKPAESMSAIRAKEVSGRTSKDDLLASMKKEKEDRELTFKLEKEKRNQEVAQSIVRKSVTEVSEEDGNQVTKSQDRVAEVKGLTSGKAKAFRDMFEQQNVSKPSPKPVARTAYQANERVKTEPKEVKQEESAPTAVKIEPKKEVKVQESTPVQIHKKESYENKAPVEEKKQETPAPSSTVPETTKSAAKKSNLVLVALYDYEKTVDDEISLREGELIVDVVQDDDSWWLGTNEAGQRGLFPFNFVAPEGSSEAQEAMDFRKEHLADPQESILDESPAEGDSASPICMARVLFDYDGGDDDELVIHENEVVDIFEKREDGWWVARNESKKIGLVPSNFVEEI